VRYVTTLASGAILIALCGCGAAKTRVTGYSVPQVEAAFKAHGLQLHQARFGPATGIVKLLGPGRLEVDVDVAHKRTGATEWLVASTMAERSTSQHNVIVTWQPRLTKSVKAALRQLN
jgi:hypothetical protein